VDFFKGDLNYSGITLHVSSHILLNFLLAHVLAPVNTYICIVVTFNQYFSSMYYYYRNYMLVIFLYSIMPNLLYNDIYNTSVYVSAS